MENLKKVIDEIIVKMSVQHICKETREALSEAYIRGLAHGADAQSKAMIERYQRQGRL